MLIIGSTAIKHYFPDWSHIPKDLDYTVDIQRNNEPGIEYLYNPVILKYQNGGYLKPELMLSLKISHMFWDINWYKHMFHIQFLLSKDIKYDLDLVNELIEFWKITHKKIRRSDLSSGKEEFFTNNVNEDVGQHDHLHTLINPIPMYTLLLKDGCEVELDESKFHNMSFDQKKAVIFEETAVMAYERYPKMDYRNAFKIQLKDNIIKHFPQYIALFAIENYIELEKPNYNYIKKIQEQL